MKTKSTHKSKTSRYVVIGLIVASIVYVSSQYVGSTQAAVGASSQAQTGTVTTKSTSPTQSSGTYANGSYTGTSADAYYGTVQVKAVVRNGQLADVQFLQYPNTHSYSVYVNNQAMPVLTQEALQAQSAQVNGVSGATFTSQAFQQSLASALVRAKG